jgi:hypothetical protein
MDQTRKVVTSFTIAPDLLERLCEAAAADERSRSFLVGRAIERFLENPKPAPLELAGAGCGRDGGNASDRCPEAETVAAGRSQDLGAENHKMPGEFAALRVAVVDGLLEPSDRGAATETADTDRSQDRGTHHSKSGGSAACLNPDKRASVGARITPSAGGEASLPPATGNPSQQDSHMDPRPTPVQPFGDHSARQNAARDAADAATKAARDAARQRDIEYLAKLGRA